MVGPYPARRAVLPRTAGGLGCAVIGLVVLVLCITLVPGLLGYQRFVVVGGSMEPTIHKGSIVFDELVPEEDLRPGDVITYVMPGHDTPSTHRIVDRELGPNGAWVFRTKGDANAAEDAQPFMLDKPVQARVALAVPYVGWLFIWLSSPQVRMGLVIAPALMIVLFMLIGLWRESGRLLEEQRA
jgi:signal peptidase